MIRIPATDILRLPSKTLHNIFMRACNGPISSVDVDTFLDAIDKELDKRNVDQNS